MSGHKDDQFDDGLDDAGFDQFDELPEDDFADDPAQDSGDSDESFSEEEWDSYDEQGGGEAPAPPAKKKSNLFNIIVISIAILGGAGFFLLKSGSGTPPAKAPVVAQNEVANNAPPPAAAIPAQAPEQVPAQAALPPATPPTTEGGFLTSPDNLAAMEQDIARTYEEAELVPEGSLVETDQPAPPMPNAMGHEQTAAPSAPAEGAEQPAIRMPNAAEALLKSAIQEKQAKQATDNIAAPAAETAAPMDALSSAAPVVSGSADTTALTAKMDDILSRLQRMEGDISGLKAAKSNNAVSAETAAEIKALADRVAALDRKMAAQPVAAPKTENKAEKQLQQSAKESDDDVVAVPAPKPQILGSTPQNTPVLSARPQAAPRDSAASPQWVLKGAQPGRAMVSRPGEGEMRNVVVGDTLPGIGTIRSIGYENGRWQIIGTQGRISQ